MQRSMQTHVRFLLLGITSLMGFTGISELFAQTPSAPTTEVEKPLAADGTEWKPVDPFSILSELRPELVNTPTTNLTVKIGDRILAIEPIDLRLGSADSGNRDTVFERAREVLVERWPLPNGRIRRYVNDVWVARLNEYRSGSLKGERAFLRYRIREKGLATAKEIHSVELSKLNILCLPQTWENIWISQVASAPADKRLEQLKAFDAAFAEVIENKKAKGEWFSREEKAAYARFYQDQFVFIRDQNPKLPDIYIELARFHTRRDSVDSLIDVYLDAIANELPEESLQLVRLRLGQTLVNRLRLYRDAIPHLHGAIYFAQGRLLLVRAYLETRQFSQAADAARILIGLLESLRTQDTPSEPIVLDEEDPRDVVELLSVARLLLARAHLGAAKLDEAFLAFRPLLVNDTPASDEATILYASMLVYRGRPNDLLSARRVLTERPRIQAAILSATRPKANAEEVPLTYDPLVATAVCLWVETQIDPRVSQRFENLQRVLHVAASLDPLSVDAFLLLGRIEAYAGNPSTALLHYNAGLTRNPSDSRLHLVLGELHLRANELDQALDHFQASLRSSPENYPAFNGLGDVALARVSEVERDILNVVSQEERDVLVNRVVALRRQASASYATSLELQPHQSVIRNRLAALNCTLATSAPSEDVRLSYLRNAKVLAQVTMQEVRRLGENSDRLSAESRYAIADTPPVSAFMTFAYASYEIYSINRDRRQVEDAVAALSDAIIFGTNARYFGDQESVQVFANSPSMAWARETLSRIQANERRRRQIETFDDRTISLDERRNGDMGKGWKVLPGEKPDRSMLEGLQVQGGQLSIVIKEQNKEGQISRISRQEPFNTLAGFRANLPYLGVGTLSRGLHVTRVTTADDGKAIQEAWSLMVGFDENNQLFWDVREGILKDGIGTSALIAGPQYIDLKRYGLDILDAQLPMTMGLQREVSPTLAGTFDWILSIGDYRLRLPFNEMNVSGSVLTSARAVSDAVDNPEDGLRFGFFTLGRKGSSGSFVVDDVEWVHDHDIGQVAGE